MNDYLEMEEGLNLREFLLRIKTKWHWIAICGLLGAGISYFINKIYEPKYEIGTTLLSNDNNIGIKSEDLFQNLSQNSKTNVQDQIGILSSYMINLETMEQLDWKITWFQKGFMTHTDLYQNGPYQVVKQEDSANLTGIPLYFMPISENAYRITVDDKVMVNNVKQDIQFTQDGQFGKPFSNPNFHFIINKLDSKPIDKNYQYFFVFNDLNELTKTYQNKLEISMSDDKSNLIYVKIKSSKPERAVDYLNTLSKVFIQFGLHEKNQASENTVNFIDSQLSGIVDSLQQAGRNFTNFRSQNRIVDLSQEAGLIMDRLKEVESSISMASMRLDYYKNLLQYLGDAKQMEQMVAPSVVGITDQSLNALVVKLGELYAKRSSLALSAQEKNPSLLALDNEITYTRQGLEENLKNLISNAEVEIGNLNQRKNTINAQLSKLPRTEQNMVNIKRRFDLNNELYTYLLQKRAEAAITRASTIPDVQVLDLARVATAKPQGTSLIIKILIGLFCGMIFPVVFIMIGDYFNNRIKSKEDIDKGTTLPTIGVIAHNKLKTEFPVLKYPHAGITESFRALRTNLQYLMANDQQKVVAIHSTISGEGKSFVSLNLASAMALNNKRVLLVDADLRKPQLHLSFNYPNEIGLSTYLINKNNFEEIVVPSKIKYLNFVSSGPVPRNSAELLGGDRFTQFIEEARNHFDYIILNSSPISVVTDGVLIGKSAEINLIILRQDFSYKDHLKLINDFSEQGVLKNIALIFNDVQLAGYSYYNIYNTNGYGYYAESDSKNKKSWHQKKKKEIMS